VLQLPTVFSTVKCCTGLCKYRGAVSPWPNQEGKKLQRQKILSFVYPIYNHNWKNISTIYIYITRPASNQTKYNGK